MSFDHYDDNFENLNISILKYLQLIKIEDINNF